MSDWTERWNPAQPPSVIEFLKVRLDEDEAVAREAAVDRAGWTLPASAVVDTGDQGGDILTGDQRLARHIARHDPARVLREVAAKRIIIQAAEDANGLDLQVEGEFGVGRRDEAKDPYVGDVILRAMASAWSDHPEFREEWKP